MLCVSGPRPVLSLKVVEYFTYPDKSGGGRLNGILVTKHLGSSKGAAS